MKSSRTRKVLCNVCGQSVQRKNFADHFKRKHPMEEQAGIQPSLTSPPGATSGHSKHDVSIPNRNNNDPPISTPTKETSAAPHSTGHQSRTRKRKIEEQPATRVSSRPGSKSPRQQSPRPSGAGHPRAQDPPQPSAEGDPFNPVSYTHLTLPTNREV